MPKHSCPHCPGLDSYRHPPPPLQAIPLLKESIKKAYGKKGEKVVAQNCAAVDAALDRLVKVDIPPGWGREVRRRNCCFGSFNC